MSDGVQSRVMSDYPDAIYVPIETSGDSEIAAKSRVQMKLYEAKIKAREEFAEVLRAHNVTVERVRDYASKHPRYTNAMRQLPQRHGIGTATNFAAEIARRIR
jgi:uroporphyrinogen-III synthase